MVNSPPPLEHITRTIVERFRPRRVVLFGSRARGNARPDSDVDLMIEMDSPLRRGARAVEILKAFGLRAWAMDVVVYTPEEVERLRGKPGTLLATIENEGQILYEQPTGLRPQQA